MKLPPITLSDVESKIYLIRGRKIILDVDLAGLYGVTTFNLNKAVRRNKERFPPDFRFELTEAEAEPLKFQIGMSKKVGRGGRRTLPAAFTHEGIAMLSSVLRSEQAIQVNIAIIRVFVRIRELLISHKELSKRLDALEDTHEQKFKVVFDAIRELMSERAVPLKRIIGLGEGNDSDSH